MLSPSRVSNSPRAPPQSFCISTATPAASGRRSWHCHCPRWRRVTQSPSDNDCLTSSAVSFFSSLAIIGQNSGQLRCGNMLLPLVEGSEVVVCVNRQPVTTTQLSVTSFIDVTNLLTSNVFFSVCVCVYTFVCTRHIVVTFSSLVCAVKMATRLEKVRRKVSSSSSSSHAREQIWVRQKGAITETQR